MKNLALTIGFVLSISILFGQAVNETDSTTTDRNAFNGAKRIVKFSPFDLFSAVPTFGADMEFFEKNGAALQVGVAAIPSTFQILASDAFSGYDRMSGYRLRAEGRLYMPKRPNRYMAFGLSFRHIIIRDEIAVGMEGTDGDWGQRNYAYFINTPMTFHRFNTNYEVKFGYQKLMGKTLIMDFYTGLSIRNINVQSRSEIPVGGEIPDQGGVWTLHDNYKLTYPTPIIGFKIGFVSK